MDLLRLLVQLIIDCGASWVRMFISLGISVVISFGIGILAATSRKAERVVLPLVDILQTLPILAFFPIAITVFLVLPVPEYIGINAAVIFLIITSMVWNIIFGVYESIKTLPIEFFEVVELYHFDFWSRLKKLYIPACLPRVIEQSILSWAIGLFYLVTSEIFSTGSSSYTVTYGIGVYFVRNAGSNLIGNYLLGIAVFIAFVIATRLLFFRPLEEYSTRYTRSQPSLKQVGYQKTVLDWVAKGLKSRYIRDLHKVTKEIRVVKRPLKALMAKEEPKHIGRTFLIVFLALVLVAIFEIIRNYPVLGTYELQVLPNLAFSFARIWLAFLLISILAIPICVYIIFLSKQGLRYLMLFQIVASVPATILLPLIVQLLLTQPFHDELVAFVIFVLSGFWYIIFSIVASTRTIPNNILEVKRLFGVSGARAWKEIYIPAILPGFITGALTGIAAEWNASIVAEYFTNGSVPLTQVGLGIGKLLDTALSSGNLVFMTVALLNLVVMIILINTFVWKRAYRGIAKVYS